jgi:hypothetical protein
MSVEFPKPVSQRGRIFFVEIEVENYVRALADIPPLATDGQIRLIPAAAVAAKLGVCRRTIGRRIVEVPSVGRANG